MMLRTATLLIVVVLAGASTRSLACELWCATPAADTHHRAVGCHDASQAEPKAARIARHAGCHDAVAIMPFITEARQTESRFFGYVATSPALFQSRSIVQHNDGIVTGWSVFNGQPPHGSSSRPVLRV